MWRIQAILALAVSSCVAGGASTVRQEDPVSITVVPVPSGGAPMYFPTRGPGYVPEDDYVGYPELGSIREAALLGDALALLGTSGTLIALNLSDGNRHVLAEDVLDMTEAAGRLWLVRSSGLAPDLGDPPADGRLMVSSWDGQALAERAPIAVPGGDWLRALVIEDGVPIVVTSRSVFRAAPNGDAWHEIGLDGALAPSDLSPAAIASTGDLYVGADLGEFGGGLQRIDPATGEITDLCREPWRMCSNVSAIVADPRKPGCVIVAEGLWHMASVSGSVARVCRDRADVVLRRPLAKDPFGTGGVISGEEEFSDLAVTADGRIWAAGMGAVYEIDGARRVRHTLPPLEPLHQLYAIRSFPGLLVLFDGAAIACGDTLRRDLPEGSAPPPDEYVCGFWMASWSPMLFAAPAP